MVRYPVGESGQVLILTDGVLAHFMKHRQRKRRQPEAGGQLFARIDGNLICVEEATGPRRTDTRTRTSYQADPRSERAEIEGRHDEGLHYIGDWHTHPARHAVPSSQDVETIRDIFRQSQHSLDAVVLIVVGTDSSPEAIRVSIHNGHESLSLVPVRR